MPSVKTPDLILNKGEPGDAFRQFRRKLLKRSDLGPKGLDSDPTILGRIVKTPDNGPKSLERIVKTPCIILERVDREEVEKKASEEAPTAKTNSVGNSDFIEKFPVKLEYKP